ncbi:unnamed protein product, partial [Gadus morhua 'NCC']
MEYDREPEEQQRACSQGMSVARIHDKHKLKSFWEQRIQQHILLEGAEHSRERQRSAQ